MDFLDFSAGNIMLFVLAVLGFITLKRSVYVVSQSNNFVVERFGRFRVVLLPGLNLVVPYLDRVAHRVSVLERQSEPSRVSVFSSDNVEVEIVTVVYWRVHDAHLSVYRIEDVSDALIVATGSLVRNIGAGMELDKLQGSRETINRQVMASLGETAKNWGIEITRTEVVDIALDEKTKQAQRQQVEAERARRAQVTAAEGTARAVQLEADAVLYRSEREAQALVLAAEARAKEIRLVANAQGREIEVVGAALRDFGDKAALFELGKRQVTAMQAMAAGPGSRLVVLPTEITRILGGIMALVDEKGLAGFVGSDAREGFQPADEPEPEVVHPSQTAAGEGGGSGVGEEAPADPGAGVEADGDPAAGPGDAGPDTLPEEET